MRATACLPFCTSEWIRAVPKADDKIYKKFIGPTCAVAEGFILGVGAKIFTIAGPVIVYGLSASVVYGFIYWLWTLLA